MFDISKVEIIQDKELEDKFLHRMRNNMEIYIFPSSESIITYLAKYRGFIIGCVSLRPTGHNGRLLNLHNFIVKKKYRRMGVGTKLLEYVISSTNKEIFANSVKKELLNLFNKFRFNSRCDDQFFGRTFYICLPNRNKTIDISKVEIIHDTDRIEAEDFYEREYGDYDWMNETDTVYIAKYDNSVIGSIVLEEKKSKIFFCNFQIQEEFRKQGVGTKLLNHIIQIIDKPLYAMCITKKNVVFYKRFGFKSRKMRENSYYIWLPKRILKERLSKVV